MTIKAPLASLSLSVFARAFKIKSKPARLLILSAFLVASTAALAAVASPTGALQKIFFGSRGADAQTNPIQPKAALNPVWAAAVTPQSGATMNVERRGHAATRLSDGRVLISGGENSGGVLNECEIYDPVAGTFSVAGNMTAARADHAAVLLADGRVLLMGGRGAVGAVNTTEIFDPTSGSFTAGANMSVARAGHSATLFADGRLFVAGGDANGSAEVFDPSTGAFSAVGANLSSARSMHSAALLLDGRVLLVGGRDASGSALSSGEIFDASAGTFSAVDGNLTIARVQSHLRVLFDGKVQVIGGSDDGSMEIYDPAIAAFGAYAHVVPDSDPCPGLHSHVLASETRAALFHNGQADPLLDRSGHTITELGSQALVVGGMNSSGAVLSSTELVSSSTSSITTDKLDYAPGETVSITGRGFAPGETVRVKIHEDPHTELERGFDVVADADGNFSGEYLVMDYDLNMKFIVGARGLTSGRTAQTTFTDGNFDVKTSGPTYTLVREIFNPATNCSGSPISTTTTSVSLATPTTFPINANTKSVRLTVQGPPAGFLNWSTASLGGGVSVFSNVGNVICLNTPSASGSGEFTANFASTATTTAVTSSQDPSTYGQAVTFTATVSPTSGVTPPTGSVQFKIDGADFGLPVALTPSGSNGVANSDSISTLNVADSPHEITAVYTATGSFTDSTSPVFNQDVVKATLVVTPDPQTVTYGAADPTFTFSYSGFVLGDDSGDLTSQAVCSVPGASPHSAAGSPYTISCVAGTADNYVFDVTATAVFTVNKATLTVTPDPQTVTYGDADPTFTFSYSGFVLGDDSGDLTTQAVCSVPGASPHSAAGSPYTISCVAGTADNYVFNVTATAVFTVNTATLTVTPDPQTVTYGDADPTFTFSYAGFVLGDDSGDLTTQAVCSVPGASPHSAAGSPYTISCVAGTADNYVFNVTATAVFTVNKATLTVTPDPQTVTYGAADPTFTFSYSGFVLGDDSGDLTTQAVCSVPGASPHSAAGSPYTISCVAGTADNYVFNVTATAVFTVNKATLTVTPDPQTVTYGAADPTFTFSYSGFVLGDDSGDLTTQAVCSVPGASPHSAAGSPYTISCVAGTADNYVFNVTATAVFTVNKATLTVTPDPQTVTYGAADPTFTFSYSGFVLGDDENDLTTQAVCSVPGASPHSAAGSPYTISCVAGTADNYVFNVTATAVFTVNKATLTVTPDPQTVTYGAADPTFTFSYSGFVLGDDSGDLTTQAVCSVPGASPHSAAGSPYTISCVAGTADNYVFNVTATAVFTVNKATLTVTPDPQTVTYGAADPTFTFSYSGFVLGDDSGDLTTQAVCSVPGASPHSAAGSPYTISCVAGTADNYVFDVTATAVFTVNKATLTVTPDPQTVTYGAADPTFTFSYAGFVLGDDSGDLTTQAVCSVPGASPHSAAGSPYTISCVAGTADNYVFDVTATAVFTVNKATLTVTPDPQTVTYGTADPTFTFSYAGFVLGDDQGDLTTQAVCSVPGASPHSAAGSPYTISCVAGTADNYVFDVTATAVFTVNKATLVVTPDPQTVTYGAADPTFTFSYSGFVLGDDSGDLTTQAVCSVPGTSPHSALGSPYTISCVAGTADNYVFNVTATAVFTVNKATLVVTPDPQTVTYGAADPTFTFSYSGFVLGDDSGDLTTQAVCSVPGASPHSAAGSPYTISCVAGTADNYVFNVTATAVFTVNKAMLTITASSHTITFNDPVPTITPSYSGFVAGDDATDLTTQPTCTTTYTVGSLIGDYPSSCSGAVSGNYNFIYVDGKVTVLTACSVFNGFLPPIGGVVEQGTGGSFANPVRAFKLNSTIPVKFSAVCFGVPLVTGDHKLYAIKYSTSVDSDPAVDATPTDAATIGNLFRLTGSEWHFNMNTKGLGNNGQGTWLLEATLFDGSKYHVWISIKK